MVVNAVVLGAISELTGIDTRRSLERLLLCPVPQGTKALNQKALTLGVKLVLRYCGQQSAEDDQDMSTDSI